MALLVVTVSIALLASVVADFQFNSRVDLQLAINSRDELQAEYNALSALRMRALLLKNSRLLSQSLGQLLPSAPPIGQLLEMLPVECGLLSAVLKSADAFAEEEEGQFLPGQCVATSESEHSKVSLLALRNNINNSAQLAQQQLLGLLGDPKMEHHFQSNGSSKSDSPPASNPLELIAAISDWTDPDDVETGTSVGDEDRHYAPLDEPYSVKSAPFDSLAELQLVHGVNDALYDILKPHVTIYNPTPQIELATAPVNRILLQLCSAMPPGIGCSDMLLHPGFLPFFVQLNELRQLGGLGLGVLQVSTLSSLLQSTGLASIVDTSKLNDLFSDKSSTTWYTIEAQGQVGNASKRLTGVFQAVEGEFYYFRVD